MSKKNNELASILAVAFMIFMVALLFLFIFSSMEWGKEYENLNSIAESECRLNNGTWGDTWMNSAANGFSCTFEDEVCEYHPILVNTNDEWMCKEETSLVNSRRRK